MEEIGLNNDFIKKLTLDLGSEGKVASTVKIKVNEKRRESEQNGGDRNRHGPVRVLEVIVNLFSV